MLEVTVSVGIVDEVQPLNKVSQEHENFTEKNQDSSWLVEMLQSEDSPNDSNDSSDGENEVGRSCSIEKGDSDEGVEHPSEDVGSIVNL